MPLTVTIRSFPKGLPRVGIIMIWLVQATLGKVREQLEGRVTALEARISNSPELTGDISTMDPQHPYLIPQTDLSVGVLTVLD